MTVDKIGILRFKNAPPGEDNILTHDHLKELNLKQGENVAWWVKEISVVWFWLLRSPPDSETLIVQVCLRWVRHQVRVLSLSIQLEWQAGGHWHRWNNHSKWYQGECHFRFKVFHKLVVLFLNQNYTLHRTQHHWEGGTQRSSPTWDHGTPRRRGRAFPQTARAWLQDNLSHCQVIYIIYHQLMLPTNVTVLENM